MTPQQIAELVKRLQGIRTRVGHMCSHHHPPRMSVPASPDDDDLFIANAADEAAAALTALQERVQELHAGDEQRVRDLTKWIEQAEKAEARLSEAERALTNIAQGNFNTDFVMAQPPNWHKAFSALQALAREAIASRHPTSPETK